MSTAVRLALWWMVLLKASQNSCHSWTFPLNFLTSSLGSLALPCFVEGFLTPSLNELGWVLLYLTELSVVVIQIYSSRLPFSSRYCSILPSLSHCWQFSISFLIRLSTPWAILLARNSVIQCFERRFPPLHRLNCFFQPELLYWILFITQHVCQTIKKFVEDPLWAALIFTFFTMS